MTPTTPCPACGQPVELPPQVKQVFACPHCRQELRRDGQALTLVVDPSDFRHPTLKAPKPPNIFRDI